MKIIFECKDNKVGEEVFNLLETQFKIQFEHAIKFIKQQMKVDMSVRFERESVE